MIPNPTRIPLAAVPPRKKKWKCLRSESFVAIWKILRVTSVVLEYQSYSILQQRTNDSLFFYSSTQENIVLSMSTVRFELGQTGPNVWNWRNVHRYIAKGAQRGRTRDENKRGVRPIDPFIVSGAGRRHFCTVRTVSFLAYVSFSFLRITTTFVPMFKSSLNFRGETIDSNGIRTSGVSAFILWIWKPKLIYGPRSSV